MAKFIIEYNNISIIVNKMKLISFTLRTTTTTTKIGSKYFKKIESSWKFKLNFVVVVVNFQAK